MKKKIFCLAISLSLFSSIIEFADCLHWMISFAYQSTDHSSAALMYKRGFWLCFNIYCITVYCTWI